MRHLVRQGGTYGLVGLLQLGIDWLAYVLLTSLGLSVVPSNVVARVCGATLGFTMNGLYTFRGEEGARLGWRRLLRFITTWVATTGLSTAAMFWVDANHGLGVTWIAKPAVDVVLAGVGFLASRQWIYR